MLAQARANEVKTIFQYARGHMYSGHCCQYKTKNHTSKYTREIHGLEINTVQQRISKTKKLGGGGWGGGGGGGESIFLAKSLVWQHNT